MELYKIIFFGGSKSGSNLLPPFLHIDMWFSKGVEVTEAIFTIIYSKNADASIGILKESFILFSVFLLPF